MPRCGEVDVDRLDVWRGGAGEGREAPGSVGGDGGQVVGEAIEGLLGGGGGGREFGGEQHGGDRDRGAVVSVFADGDVEVHVL
ncbi:MAG: hypothetical protein ABEN55_24105 [Bradymonadaceae bacterium]